MLISLIRKCVLFFFLIFTNPFYLKYPNKVLQTKLFGLVDTSFNQTIDYNTFRRTISHEIHYSRILVIIIFFFSWCLKFETLTISPNYQSSLIRFILFWNCICPLYFHFHCILLFYVQTGRLEKKIPAIWNESFPFTLEHCKLRSFTQPPRLVLTSPKRV